MQHFIQIFTVTSAYFLHWSKKNKKKKVSDRGLNLALPCRWSELVPAPRHSPGPIQRDIAPVGKTSLYCLTSSSLACLKLLSQFMFFRQLRLLYSCFQMLLPVLWRASLCVQANNNTTCIPSNNHHVSPASPYSSHSLCRPCVVYNLGLNKE